MLSNVTSIFSDNRLCVSTLALRYLNALHDCSNVHALQLKQLHLVRVPPRSAAPASILSARVAVLVYAVDLCCFRNAQRSVHAEAGALRDALTSAMIVAAPRSCVLLLLTNVVQFCMDIERYKITYAGAVGYQGAPGCAVSLYRFVERVMCSAVPPNVALHVATPKLNSRFDFSQVINDCLVFTFSIPN